MRQTLEDLRLDLSVDEEDQTPPVPAASKAWDTLPGTVLQHSSNHTSLTHNAFVLDSIRPAEDPCHSVIDIYSSFPIDPAYSTWMWVSANGGSVAFKTCINGTKWDGIESRPLLIKGTIHTTNTGPTGNIQQHPVSQLNQHPRVWFSGSANQISNSVFDFQVKTIKYWKYCIN